jgi:hypothetical protein
LYCSARAPLEGVYFCCRVWLETVQIHKNICKTYSNRHVAVSIGLNSVDDWSESGSRRCISADGSRRVDILEERKRDRSDRDWANLFPLVDGIIELLSSSKSVEVPTKLVWLIFDFRNWINSPGVTVVVRVLGISANSNTRALSNTLVDVVDGAEGISDDLVVSKSLVTAGLESGRIARGSRIEDVNASQDRVCILAGSTTSSIGKSIGASPVRLKEAKDKRSLGNTVGARLSKLSGKAVALNQSTILDSSSEEGRAVNLLPQIETSLVPVLGHIRQVILNNRPDDVVDGCGVAIGLWKGWACHNISGDVWLTMR